MSIFNKVSKTFQWGQHTVTLETGEIARQSTGAVLVDMDGTVVLATVVAKSEAKPGQDFFPLTVDYLEKTYAAGRIPGSFFKREGRPSEGLFRGRVRPRHSSPYRRQLRRIFHAIRLSPTIFSEFRQRSEVFRWQCLAAEVQP